MPLKDKVRKGEHLPLHPLGLSLDLDLFSSKIEMTENELSNRIIGCALKVHKSLGPGLLESAYEECLYYEMVKDGSFSKSRKHYL